MVQKYQNEISPIFYYGKKLKTSEKLLKIPHLRRPDWGQPYWMTLYHGAKNEIINVKENKQFNFVQTVHCHCEGFIKIKVG